MPGNAELASADEAEWVRLRELEGRLEVRVARPPTDRVGALALAWEHFVYCPDRVYQGTRTGTLDELAAELLNAPVRYFWWDSMPAKRPRLIEAKQRGRWHQAPGKAQGER
jgi:hypothetical protein